MKKKLGYKWFNFYIDFIPVWCIFTVLNFLLNMSSIVENGFNFGYILDIGIFAFYIKVVYDLMKSKKNSIFELCIWLSVIWIYRSLSVSLSELEDNFTLAFCTCFLLFGLWYLPNILYFSKRLDGIRQRKIEETDEDADEFIRKLKEKNGEERSMNCKVCGKQIPYNENGTCEECHKIILERIEAKKIVILYLNYKILMKKQSKKI